MDTEGRAESAGEFTFRVYSLFFTSCAPRFTRVIDRKNLATPRIAGATVDWLLAISNLNMKARAAPGRRPPRARRTFVTRIGTRDMAGIEIN
ncbi:hypothetical protein EVAR_13612_1 [Eumeta japonica]|uniref:Uncharacterized protein n=1 Tax=Eumeta variegata TaxID=151549 RepID=A0A4C1UTR4_EUMVA|nr:hypothetical protein EVAR_13612_1 [Eumeta japonica]